MPDYGHTLSFGAFLTPQADDPQRVVALAQASERHGLDLVTFQDHPYQPSFLDTWTLLSWVAASTQRVQLAGNVLNLPLRPPAVLAKAAASLDLLSGGRVALGLGSGAFWDAIVAMGAPRMTPGQAVTALDEGIDVIRGLWDTDTRGVLRAGGGYHGVDGAKRGPAPAHDIPIWLGAYKPRMLGLVGRKADGWLPSLGYLQPGDLAAGNARIDEAAAEAGRDPREIRRLLNLGGITAASIDDWVDELLPMVLEDGVSTLVLGSDDERALALFGEELAPALREAVASERRAAGTTTGAVRSAASLAKRAPGIDYDAIPPALADLVVEPGDRGYGAVRSTYIWAGSPGLVVQPRDAAGVAEAVRFARTQDVPFAVRSGGHGIAGRSTNDGGIVIDLGALDSIEVLDPDRRVVRLGAGAHWGDVAATLSPLGMAISSGDYGDVGVGGLVVAGGQGLLGRSYGLTLDHVVAAEVVLADGSLVRASADEHPDLLWAVRGAGAAVGIVVSVDVEAAPVGDVVLATFVYDATDTAALLVAWADQVERSPWELTSFLTLVPARRDQPAIAQAMTVWAGDDTEAAVAALDPFMAVGPVLQQQANLLPYSGVMQAHHARHEGGAPANIRGGLVEHVTPRVAGVLADLLAAHESPMLQLRAVGGAVNATPADATAYAHRTQNFSLSAITTASGRAALDRRWDQLSDDVTGVYRSFDLGDDRLERAYPPATLARLRTVAATYDPDGIFGHDLPVHVPR
ncbi:LLM class flavin-dependent oxidoreductase [Cellulomonas rhizosphaerae]|uniref:LLM class flavin-dependent oxidoreductase n=1 Tax=Cellulomonas rhizosphaerae TaxID=2293719 RepID=A0A413RLD1_9CELL|nr:LLM class flavin-dependent oxidoreductase [Cellulomonas rhizosphaerae]RHA40707.1 LLM class flavin-dependent oxidoreductase [Cellulomonas rhizosphaerae]